MNIDVLFAAVTVTELDRSQSWYERLFDRPPDILPNDDEAMWRVAESGWLYLTVDTERAGRSVVTMAVHALDTVVADLADRDVALGATKVVPGAGRKARYADPDGNLVWIIEVDG